MEELKARHRKELKDLQGKITSKKKNATKKTRKGVNDECERLERELRERQESELRDSDPSSADLADEVADLHVTDDNVNGENNEKTESDSKNNDPNSPHDPSTVYQAAHDVTSSKKPNRQKARLARRQAEQEAQVVAAEAEAAAMPNQRELEMKSMKAEMQKRDLAETLIRPDGHCMFSACALTLPGDQKQGYQEVRSEAASFIAAHPGDFAPFMEESIESYTTRIKETAEWGGHLELLAISKAYNVKINVLRANGRVDIVSPDEHTDNAIWLAYYQHSFGLGEHYNALKKTGTGPKG